ncbi:hypothetical protein ScPMuIL_010210 [Solemya velum]
MRIRAKQTIFLVCACICVIFAFRHGLKGNEWSKCIVPVDYDGRQDFGVATYTNRNSPRPLNTRNFSMVHRPSIQFRLLLGTPRLTKGFLTIGIPTVWRENGSYIVQTVQSLIENMDQKDFNQTVLVIFTADFKDEYNQDVVDRIKRNFPEHIDSGFIEVISVPEKAYPPLTNLKQTFGDPTYRVEWRSKQNIDYSLLMLYSANKSKFYLQLEDDTTTVSHYVEKIRDYIRHVESDWAMLEFSLLGFIGKLFHSEDVSKFSNLLWTFYSEMPCDFLFKYFLDIKLQTKRLFRIPTLFQHHGLSSSLTNLTRNVSDRYFVSELKIHKGDNPAAVLSTTMKIYDNNTPTLAYSTSDNGGKMWVMDPQPGDSLTIVFKEKQNIKRVIIETGFPVTGQDSLKSAIIEISSRLLMTNNETCIAYSAIGEFQNGRADIPIYSSANKNIDIRCLRVTVTSKQKEWLLVREIAVFTNKNPARVSHVADNSTEQSQNVLYQFRGK